MIEIRYRGRAILIGYLLFCVLYLGAARLAVGTPRLLTESRVDLAFPFMPDTVVVYASQFVFMFLALWLARDSRELTRTFVAVLTATLMSCVVFVAQPTTIARPLVSSRMFDALWMFDVPTNCFPSLHIALALIAAVFWPHPRTRIGAWVWALAIAVSTMTTKQHYFVDVVGGVMVGFIAVVAAERLIGRS